MEYWVGNRKKVLWGIRAEGEGTAEAGERLKRTDEGTRKARGARAEGTPRKTLREMEAIMKSEIALHI